MVLLNTTLTVFCMEPLKSLLLRLKKLQKDQVQEQMQVLTLQQKVSTTEQNGLLTNKYNNTIIREMREEYIFFPISF